VALSSVEIAQILHEIAPALIGGAVQKVFQPTEQAIVLEIRKPGRSVTLLLSADPETARLHLISARPSNPPSPPPFCQLLRAHLEGCRILAIEQLQADRIIRLKLMGREGNTQLVAELTGRSANLLLLDAEERILGALRPEHAKAGQQYAPLLAGNWTSPNAPSSLHSDHFPISEAVEQRYQQQEAERAQLRLRRTRLGELRKAVRKTTRRLEGLKGDLSRAARYREYARYGELLKGRLGEIAKGQDRIAVVDYFDPALSELILPLDPAKGANANMEEYFKKHRKHLAAERAILPRIHAAEEELASLRSALAALERGEPIAPDQPQSTEVRTRQSAPRLSQKSRGPFRRFVSSEGLPIFVGRNARENEELTFGVARSHDLWFHAQGTPGSHVVLRLDKGADPPVDSLRDAATLALLYSDLRKSGKGEVIYTKRSSVRKVKGKSPGTVTATQEKTLFVELDQVRLRRLNASSAST